MPKVMDAHLGVLEEQSAHSLFSGFLSKSSKTLICYVRALFADTILDEL